VLFVLDRSRPLDDARVHARNGKVLFIANKSDLPAAWRRDDAIEVSAVTGEGLDTLRAGITKALDVEMLQDPPAMTNVRHIALVERADDALRRAKEAARADRDRSLPEEFVLADLQAARSALEEISGRRAAEDLLDHIFSRFCIGK
jgi:tRNA modification GTPase